MSSFLMSREYSEDKTYEDGRNYEDDKKLPVRFSTRAVKNDFESTKQGRPIFQEVEYIEILVPGSRDTMVAPVDEHYKARFRERYERWKATQDNSRVEGTILSEVPWLSTSQVAELNALNIVTVEQLVDMADANSRGIMGYQQLKERAKRYLAAAAGEAPMLELERKLAERDSKIVTLEAALKKLEEKMEKMLAKA